MGAAIGPPADAPDPRRPGPERQTQADQCIEEGERHRVEPDRQSWCPACRPLPDRRVTRGDRRCAGVASSGRGTQPGRRRGCPAGRRSHGRTCSSTPPGGRPRRPTRASSACSTATCTTASRTASASGPAAGPLERMLGTGPLTGQQAGWLAREVSEALENLHRTGHAHGSISPSTVVVTDAGAIKVVGLATEAALRSSGPGSPEQDVHALGELLYASLTGRWPGPAPAWGLQPAPVEHGRLLSPAPGASRRTALAGRHLRPAARATRRGTTPRRSPAPPACPRRCPESSAARTSRRTRWTRPSRSPGRTAASTTPPRSSRRRRRRRSTRRHRPTAGVPVGQRAPAALGVRDRARDPADPAPATAAVERQRPAPRRRAEAEGLVGWPDPDPARRPGAAVGGRDGAVPAQGRDEQRPGQRRQHQDEQPAADQHARRRRPAGWPRSSAPRTSTRCRTATAASTRTTCGNTYDGKASTTWTTQSYSRPNLGGQKPGVGIIYDLGRADRGVQGDGHARGRRHQRRNC